MRAGGLDSIAVYVFWIHHEEARGTFDFSGRRNVSHFVRQAHELGLRVLLRIGPWCHGEVRNGGHPDWVLQPRTCGAPRSSDPAYLECVRGWYTALAAQLEGMYWSDGGPIVAVQVDNETSDWQYLLALKALALSVGIRPAYFVKTGWPAPKPDYPPDFPMLPLFGGYADQFWTDQMSPSPSDESYLFNHGPLSMRAPEAATSALGWVLPLGYPFLDVEIGGGMAAAYNHRVHMEAADMASMHLCDVGGGVNELGFYMYHGGVNPRSLVHTADRDAPDTTLQESSFQPAGAQNPMPSASYDFFAPLGEAGQPRPHYHMMRRLHLFVRRWSALLANSIPAAPTVLPASAEDNTTLRWYVRSNGRGAAFLFVNNYQRLAALAPHEAVRFFLRWEALRSDEEGREERAAQMTISGGDATLRHEERAAAPSDAAAEIAIPSNRSEPLNIAPNLWFLWPIRLPLFSLADADGRGGYTSGTDDAQHDAHAQHDTQHDTHTHHDAADEPLLAWATAQLVTQVAHPPPGLGGATAGATPDADGPTPLSDAAVRGQAERSTLFLLETEGVEAEVALALRGAALLQHSGTATLEGEHTVLRGLRPSHAPLATVQLGARTLEVVLLPTSAADRLWTIELGGVERLIYSEAATLVMADATAGGTQWLHLRSNATGMTTEPAPVDVRICPAVAALHDAASSAAVPQKADGVFGAYSVSVAQPPLPSVRSTSKKPAGPPRQIPVAKSGKPQEPSADDWADAATYSLELHFPRGEADLRPGLRHTAGDQSAVDLLLVIDYAADAARIYLDDALLTDNWYSGYQGDGAMQLGLSHLAGEYPSLLANGTTLELWLLPLKRSSLESSIFLQQRYWPDFGGEEAVCRLDGVRTHGLVSTALRVTTTTSPT